VLADDAPELAELSLTPVIVTGTGLHIVAASATLRPVPRRTDPLRRALPG
jgi:hypothetical protein